jgi:hypothetical protein
MSENSMKKLKILDTRFSIRCLSYFLLMFFFCLFAVQSAYAQDEFQYDDQGRHNPFIPLVTPDGRLLKLDKQEESETGLSIEGIIYDQYASSYAIVNGETVKVGDRLGNFQVLKIEKDRVVFVKDGETYELLLKKEGE